MSSAAAEWKQHLSEFIKFELKFESTIFEHPDIVKWKPIRGTEWFDERNPIKKISIDRLEVDELTQPEQPEYIVGAIHFVCIHPYFVTRTVDSYCDWLGIYWHTRFAVRRAINYPNLFFIFHSHGIIFHLPVSLRSHSTVKLRKNIADNRTKKTGVGRDIRDRTLLKFVASSFNMQQQKLSLLFK